MSRLMDTIEFNPKAVIVIDAEDLLEFVNEVYAAAEVAATAKAKNDQEGETMSRGEVSKALGVSVSTLWRWDNEGYLKGIHVGSKIFYKKSDVMRIKLNKR